MAAQASIRLLLASDPELIATAFASVGWNKPADLYRRYLDEQARGTRTVLVALWEGQFAGYLTVNWTPDYPRFVEEQIPEIQDLNVLPQHRRKRIATGLLEQAEMLVRKRSSRVGIGVGMDPSYGTAQRLYVLRGYVPDGEGVSYRNEVVPNGGAVRVDDDLVLRFVKQLS